MEVQEVITLIIQSIVVPLIIWGILEAKNYLTLKVKNAQAQRILMQVSDAAIKAVKETNQTYVDTIKGTTEWDKQAQLEAFNRARETAKSILSREAWKLLETVTGDANAYIKAAIEAAVKDSKTGVN